MEQRSKCKHKAKICDCGICIKCPSTLSENGEQKECSNHPFELRSHGGQPGTRHKEDISRQPPFRAVAPREALGLDVKADTALESVLKEVELNQYDGLAEGWFDLWLVC